MSSNDNLLDKTLKKLFDKAFEDGVVTDDEFEIIQQVELDIEEYTKYLEKAKADNKITADESERLEKLKDKIISKAETVAELDGTIDDEENALLKLLVDIVSKYQS